MLFFKKKQKEKNFEKKMEELNVSVLSDKDLKKSKRIEQHVIECLEQIIDISKVREEELEEYQVVNSYLEDIQILEDMPEEERGKINDVASNVVQLNAARTEFLNSAKKISDAQFALLEQKEKEVPAAIKRLSANEKYQETIKRDMKYLEREKSEWKFQKEYLFHQKKHLTNLLYVFVGLAVTAAVLLLILQFGFQVKLEYVWMGYVLVTVAAISFLYLKMMKDSSDIAVAERNANRAIQLQNKVKLRYVGITNAIDYACEVYHVKSSKELNQDWEYYMDAVRERERYQRTNEDLEYFNGRLVRMLTKYKMYDTQIWVVQAQALIEPKEMVEIKHALITRRQKLRGTMEDQMTEMRSLRGEVEQLRGRIGTMKDKIEDIILAVDQLMEAE